MAMSVNHGSVLMRMTGNSGVDGVYIGSTIQVTTAGLAMFTSTATRAPPCVYQLDKSHGDSQNISNGSNAVIGVQGANMDSRYTIERICSHRSQRFQLVFALRAIELLPVGLDFAMAASQEGLIVRGETESSLDRPVELLKAIYGEQLRVGTLAIRYRRRGDVIEEPYMGVRVLCAAEYYDAVRDDLVARGGALADAEVTARIAVVRATVSLVRLLGYSQHVHGLTAGSAREVIWFSHYAPIETPGQKPPQVEVCRLPP
jgi:hypothetical protein